MGIDRLAFAVFSFRFLRLVAAGETDRAVDRNQVLFKVYIPVNIDVDGFSPAEAGIPVVSNVSGPWFQTFQARGFKRFRPCHILRFVVKYDSLRWGQFYPAMKF